MGFFDSLKWSKDDRFIYSHFNKTSQARIKPYLGKGYTQTELENILNFIDYGVSFEKHMFKGYNSETLGTIYQAESNGIDLNFALEIGYRNDGDTDLLSMIYVLEEKLITKGLTFSGFLTEDLNEDQLMNLSRELVAESKHAINNNPNETFIAPEKDNYYSEIQKYVNTLMSNDMGLVGADDINDTVIILVLLKYESDSRKLDDSILETVYRVFIDMKLTNSRTYSEFKKEIDNDFLMIIKIKHWESEEEKFYDSNVIFSESLVGIDCGEFVSIKSLMPEDPIIVDTYKIEDNCKSYDEYGIAINDIMFIVNEGEKEKIIEYYK